MGLRCPNPKCGVPASEGEAFCAACGADLASAPSSELPPGRMDGIGEIPQAGASAAAAENAETLRLDSILKGRMGTDPGRMETPSSFVEVIPPAEESAAVPEEPASQFFDDCPDFKVEHDAGRIFVEGQTFPFQIRLVPLRDDVDDLFIEIRRAVTGELVGRDEPDEMLHKGWRLTIPIPFRPTTGISGKIAFDLYVGYVVKGEKATYKARHSNTVFPAKEQAKSIIRDLKIEYHNTISQGHAGDMQLDQRLRDLEALKPHSDDSAEELIKRLDFPPLWKPLGLVRCKNNNHHAPGPSVRPAPASAPVAARVSRLVLETPARKVFVYSESRLVFGRKAKLCDIPTQIRDASGRVDEDASQNISRWHGQIEAQDRDCLVSDKAWNPRDNKVNHSAQGTFIDCIRIQPSGGTGRLPAGRDFTLTLAGPSSRMPGVFGFTGHLYAADKISAFCRACANDLDSRQLSGLVLRDQLYPRDAWVCVWRALPLKALDPSWGDGCLCRCGKGFLVRVENRCEWLVPGRPLTLPGVALQVKSFEK